MQVELDDDLPAVAGHKLRSFNTPRWGVMIRVGETDAAFMGDRLEAAIEWARAHPLSYEQLVTEFADFGARHGFAHGDAEELLFFRQDLTVEQRLWLVDFIYRWRSLAEPDEGHA